MDIIAVYPTQLRLVVTTSIGLHVASFVINETQVQYVLPREKKYYFGKPNDQVLAPVLTVSVDPRHLMNALFDEPFVTKDWICSKTESQLLLDCKQLSSKIKITWSDRKEMQKKVTVDGPTFKLVIDLKRVPSKVQITKNTFELTRPKNYQIIEIK